MIEFLASLAVVVIWTLFALPALPGDTNLFVLSWLKRRDPVRIIAYLALVVAVVVWAYGKTAWATEAIRGLYSNWFSDLIFFSFTVLVIDRLVRWREAQRDKYRLISQMRSQSNDFALEAVRLANESGWLYDGTLAGAYLYLANLRNADLYHADLSKTNLNNANLSGANLSHANLDEASLRDVDFRNAHFHETSLYKACLVGANLSELMLYDCVLSGANLLGANLNEAEISMCVTRYTCLDRANLKGAYLRYAFLDDSLSLREAIYDSKTIWPENFDPAAKGAILIEKDEDAEPYINWNNRNWKIRTGKRVDGL